MGTGLDVAEIGQGMRPGLGLGRGPAKADVALLGKEVATWYVDHEGGPPGVTTSGGEYAVDHVVVGTISPNVQFGGITATGATDWCVWVTNPNGDLKDFEYSAEWGLNQGSC